ncbi:MAG TPA: hypothetical protein VMN57_07085 [Anaerolineales bacterium]|nr:hypothetical protein [Anaerolineales bacterium]
MKSNRNPATRRPFWLSALLLLAGATAGGYILMLITGITLSNFYFIAGIVFLIVAVVPIFSEVGGNASTGLRARREGKAIRDALREEQESGRYTSGTRTTYLYGICGFICFILAVVTL